MYLEKYIISFLNFYLNIRFIQIYKYYNTAAKWTLKNNEISKCVKKINY
jgi:hypothetical protein